MLPRTLTGRLAADIASSSPRRKAVVSALAVVLAGLILVLRLEELESPVLVLLAVPLAVVGLELGARIGLYAALACGGVVAAYDLLAIHAFTAMDYFVRGVVFLLMGAGVGLLADAGRMLHFEATTDALTGLLNRRAFRAELERHTSRGERYGEQGAVLFIDVDNMKQINDGQGHDAGDEALRTVAEVLVGRTRLSDLKARIGGDEFALLLPHDGNADEVADNIVSACQSRGVSVSVGIAHFGKGQGMDDAILRADRAMYLAKRRGGGRFEQDFKHLR